MGAIEYRRFGLLSATLLIAAFMWVIVSPSRADAGNWKRYERSWHHKTSDDYRGLDSYEYHYDYEYSYDYSYDHDKYVDSDCECRDDYEEETSGDDCKDPTTPDDDGGQGGNEENVEQSDDPAESALELNIDQQVQVNGGAFVDAEDEATAPEGQVGDSVVWQVTVGVDEAAADEDRTVRITWDEPENVEVTGSEVTSGTFDGTVWTVSIGDMPAILTVQSTLSTSGLGASTARIAEISCDDSGVVGADGFCDFEDNVIANNTNPAGVVAMASVDEEADTNIPSVAGVLGASTTGRGGAVLGAQTEGQVLAASSGVLAATGVNNLTLLLVGSILALAPVAIRTRK